MSVERRFYCNVCGDQFTFEFGRIKNGYGLLWDGDRTLKRVPANEAERHVCKRCMCALQAAFPEPICGQGYEDCNGGPKCGSDHK